MDRTARRRHRRGHSQHGRTPAGRSATGRPVPAAAPPRRRRHGRGLPRPHRRRADGGREAGAPRVRRGRGVPDQVPAGGGGRAPGRRPLDRARPGGVGGPDRGGTAGPGLPGRGRADGGAGACRAAAPAVAPAGGTGATGGCDGGCGGPAGSGPAVRSSSAGESRSSSSTAIRATDPARTGAVQRPPPRRPAATSCRNLIRNSSSPAYSGRTSFTATVRPPAVRPRKTPPMPPAPRRRSSRYRPTCRGSSGRSSSMLRVPPAVPPPRGPVHAPRPGRRYRP